MADNPPLWEPYKVTDEFGPVSIGGSNRIKRVWYHMLGAEDSYVDIPFAEFNAQNVAKAIEQHVGNTIDVLQLKGQSY